MKMRAMLKYRLFGLDGITRKEFHNLVEQGVIKKKPAHEEVTLITNLTEPENLEKVDLDEATESDEFERTVEEH
jgi:hypothetical protein